MTNEPVTLIESIQSVRDEIANLRDDLNEGIQKFLRELALSNDREAIAGKTPDELRSMAPGHPQEAAFLEAARRLESE